MKKQNYNQDKEQAQVKSSILLQKAYHAANSDKARIYACRALQADETNLAAMIFLIELADNSFDAWELCRDFATNIKECISADANHADGEEFTLEKQPLLQIYGTLLLRLASITRDLGRFHQAYELALQARRLGQRDVLHADRFLLALALQLEDQKEVDRLLESAPAGDLFFTFGRLINEFKQGDRETAQKTIGELSSVNPWLFEFMINGNLMSERPNVEEVGNDPLSWPPDALAHEILHHFFFAMAGIPAFFDYIQGVYDFVLNQDGPVNRS